MLAYDYPLLAAFWTLAFISLWVIFLYLVVRVLADVLRSRDLGGVKKALWIVLVVFVPFVGVVAYMIVRVGDRELALSERGYRRRVSGTRSGIGRVRSSDYSEPGCEVLRERGTSNPGW